MLVGDAVGALAHSPRLVVVVRGLDDVDAEIAEVDVHGHVHEPRPDQKAEPLDEYGAEKDERLGEEKRPKARRPRVAVHGQQVLGLGLVVVGYVAAELVLVAHGARISLLEDDDGGEADVDVDGQRAVAASGARPVVQAHARQHAVVGDGASVLARAGAGGGAAPEELVKLGGPGRRVVDRLLVLERLVGQEDVGVAHALARREDGHQRRQLDPLVVEEEARVVLVAVVVLAQAPVAHEDRVGVAGRGVRVVIGHHDGRIVAQVDDKRDLLVGGKDGRQLGRHVLVRVLEPIVDEQAAAMEFDQSAEALLLQIASFVYHLRADRRRILRRDEAAKRSQVLADLQVVVGMKGTPVEHGKRQPLVVVDGRRRSIRMCFQVLVEPEAIKRRRRRRRVVRVLGEHAVEVEVDVADALVHVGKVAIVEGASQRRRAVERRVGPGAFAQLLVTPASPRGLVGGELLDDEHVDDEQDQRLLVVTPHDVPKKGYHISLLACLFVG